MSSIASTTNAMREERAVIGEVPPGSPCLKRREVRHDERLALGCGGTNLLILRSQTQNLQREACFCGAERGICQKELIPPIRLFGDDPPIWLLTTHPLGAHPIERFLNQSLEFTPGGRCDLQECPDEASYDGPVTEEHPRQIELTQAKANRLLRRGELVL